MAPIRGLGASIYFYPRPPRGGRQAGQSLRRGTDGFLSTLSARRATRHRIRNRTMPLQFLSTPSARRATCVMDGRLQRLGISIHALREEGDFLHSCLFLPLHQFLSTPSARRATGVTIRPQEEAKYFYPRPPRGGRLTSAPRLTSSLLFLSTPSARRATKALSSIGTWIKKFLSTPSARRATAQTPAWKKFFAISIHALREEGDPPSVPHFGIEWYISIHALREEGDMSGNRSDTGHPVFLSTPSARRATGRMGCSDGTSEISIHALREEGDLNLTATAFRATNFYPRPPRGGRPSLR